MLLSLAFALVAATGDTLSVRLVVAPAETIAVHVAGPSAPAPTVVIVPGLLGSAFGFRQVLGPLQAAGMQVVVVDPLGAGGSSRPRGADYSLEAQARRVLRAVEHTTTGPVLFVGHAVGGSIALRAALQAPTLTQGVILVASGPVEEAATPGVRSALRLAPLLRFPGASQLLRARVRASLVGQSATPGWVTDAVVARYLTWPGGTGALLDALHGMAAARDTVPLGPRLAGLRCPVLLLQGDVGDREGEGGITAPEVELLRRRVPDFRREAAGHSGPFIHEERPAVVIEAVRRMARPQGARVARRGTGG